MFVKIVEIFLAKQEIRFESDRAGAQRCGTRLCSFAPEAQSMMERTQQALIEVYKRVARRQR
ncbi:MAG: hypothetical protein NVS2B7_15360 [Herpetosiphon sp.]